MSIITHVAAVANQLLMIVAGIAGVGFLIGFHELGHFLFCKLFGIRTPSFSIGMGPRIFQKKIGDTVFALSAIPFGGYVEIAGAAEVGQGEQTEAASRDAGSFAVKPYWQKMLVLSGGILFNLMFAYCALTLLFWSGMPKTPLMYPGNANTVIEKVHPGSAAQQYGLEPNDQIIAINTIPTQNSAQTAIAIIEPLAHKEVTITIERDGRTKDIPVTMGARVAGGKEIGTLGAFYQIVEQPALGFFESIKKGFELTNSIIYKTAASFKGLFAKNGMENIGGPIMVLQQTILGAAKGFKVFIAFLAFISINLGVLNVIPVPIMDGGQALFYTLEAILRRPISDKIKIGIAYTSWICVIILALYLSYKDILRIFISH